MSFYVTALYRYPVKSLSGNALNVLPLSDYGPEADREFMVVDQQGKFVTQRTLPELSQISADKTDQGLFLNHHHLTASFFLESDSYRGVETSVSVWSDELVAHDCGDAVANWLSELLEQTVRLVFLPSPKARQVDADFNSGNDQVLFADGFPLLVSSQDSLIDIQKGLDIQLDMMRFRPNIVVASEHLDQPWLEDQWQTIRIGEVELALVKPCSRCVIPSIDPLTGRKQPSVFKHLQAKRRAENGDVYFGQNALIKKPGLIRCGDKVELIS